MFERFSRSWGLIKASAGVLAKDKELLVFPLLSAACTLVVVAAFVLPALGLGALDGLRDGGGVSLLAYVLAFLFYLVQYFVIFFFNSALVGAAMIRLDGGDPTVGELHIDRIRAGDDVMIGDDVALSIHEDARAEAALYALPVTRPVVTE